MNPCDLPPCPPCPPPAPPPCPQVCKPPAKPASSKLTRTKPTMRGLHWAQTRRVLAKAILLSVIAGVCVYVYPGLRRKEAYKKFYSNSEFEEWADEMARKGHFQAVPKEVLQGDGTKK